MSLSVDAGIMSPSSPLSETDTNLYIILEKDEEDGMYYHKGHSLAKRLDSNTVFHISNNEELSVDNGFICLEPFMAMNSYIEDLGYIAKVDINVNPFSETVERLVIEEPSCIVRQIRILEVLDPVSTAFFIMDNSS